MMGSSVRATMASLSRRCRFMPLQLMLVLGVVLSYMAFSAVYSKFQKPRVWTQSREEELKQYETKEVDIHYIRSTALLDNKIAQMSDSEIEAMNDTQLMVTVLSLLDNTDYVCSRRLRMGFLGDGGWEVCDDERVRPKDPPCLVYSFDNSNTHAFDDDVSRVYKCEVHAFNADLPGSDFNRSDKIHVHGYGVGRYSEITPGGKELYTFEDIRQILGHTKRNIDLVRMDIEGGEWPALYQMLQSDELDNVKQLLVECHVGIPIFTDRLRRIMRVIRSLREAGFRKFYVHKNPRGSFHHPNYPVVRAKNYEVHYLNTNFLRKK